MVVGAPVVERHRLSLLAEHPRNEGGNGGLPVGPCHHNGQLGLGHIVQKVPIETHGRHAWLIIPHVSRMAVPKQKKFAAPQGNDKSNPMPNSHISPFPFFFQRN